MTKKQRRTAKEPRDGGGSDMTKFYVILGVVAVLGVGAIGYSVGSGGLGAAASEPVEVEGLDDPRRLVELAQGMVRGEDDAPITIVEFGDFQCPACSQFSSMVKPQVLAAFVESGRAKFVYYDFPLTQAHAHAFLAARASRCADDQERYWDYHDMLYARQNDWAFSSSPSGQFVSYAEELGLDGGDFESCLKSDEHAVTITANMRLGEILGVPGTPTVLVSRGEGMARRLSTFSYEAIRDAVEEVQGEAEAR